MKPFVSGARATPAEKHLKYARPSGALHECVPLSDLTESLLCAYDGVANLAYQKFLQRGARVGSDLEDWLDAEQEVLGEMQVDVAEFDGYVSVLASLPGYRSAQVLLGIEPRWLLIFGSQQCDDRADAPALGRSLDPLRGPPRMDAASLAVMCSHASRESVPGRAADPIHPPSNLFCILELPAEVDPARSTAVMSNGLLGVRMPKVPAKSEAELPTEHGNA
jgi:HSP20 family molecular chaperone IbpA